MSYYQISVNGGAWQSLAALGASGLRRTRAIAATDTFSFQLETATILTDANPFAYKALVSVRRQTTDDVEAATDEFFFYGRVTSQAKSGSGAGEYQTVTISGPWHWLEHTIFTQAWTEYEGPTLGSVTKPRAVLFGTSYSARITTGAQLSAILTRAVAAGAPFTFTTYTAGITPPFDEQINATCAQAVMRCLAYHPHLAVWFDYSTAIPVLHIGQRTALDAQSVALTDLDNLQIETLENIKPTGVAIYFEKVNSYDGQAVPQTTLDKYPAELDPQAEGVLSAVYDLRGDSIQTVSTLITAEAFPLDLDDPDWWIARVPRLKDYDPDDIDLSGGARAELSTLSNILVSGQALEDDRPTIEDEEVTVHAKLTKRDGDDNIIDVIEETIRLSLKVTGASVGTTLYRLPVGGEMGEAVPTGLAQQIYTEWSQTHYKGSFSSTAAEPPAFDLGKKLNITGGNSAWASMAALASEISEDIDSGTTYVSFGPSEWLDVDPWVMFSRASRSRVYASSFRMTSGADESTGTAIPPVEVAEKDGSTRAVQRLLVLPSDGAYASEIRLDPNAIDPTAMINAGDAGEASGSTALTIQARPFYVVTYVNVSGTMRPHTQKVMLLCSEAIGGTRSRLATA